MAAGRGRDFVFCVSCSLRRRFQRILSAPDDGVMAADSPRHIDRVSQPHQERGLGPSVGFFVLRIEFVACGLFRLGEQTGILDWYTILVGLLSLSALVMHGSLWVQLKTTGGVSERSGRTAGFAWWAILALTAIVTAA